MGPQVIYSSLFLFVSGFALLEAFSDKPAHRTRSGTDTPRKLGARTYKGIPRWSLLMIIVPVLNTRTQLALGHGTLNSLICLLHYFVQIRLDVSIQL